MKVKDLIAKLQEFDPESAVEAARAGAKLDKIVQVSEIEVYSFAERKTCTAVRLWLEPMNYYLRGSGKLITRGY